MLKIKSLVFGFFIIVIWIFSYSGVYGADWKFLQINFQGEFSYDAENITHSSGNIVGVSLKIVYSEKFKKEEGLDHLSETVGLWEINCQEKKMYLLSTSHTSKEGEIWPPQVWLPPEWKSISPGTIMDTLEPIAKVFFCGSTSSPRTEKFNDFNLSPFTLSREPVERSKGKLRTFAITSLYKELCK